MELQEYLKKRNLTTEQFAKLIAVSQGAVSRYATGKRFPSRDILRRIDAATKGKVRANDFVGGAP